MKRTNYTLLLSFLLVGCGSQKMPAATANAPTPPSSSRPAFTGLDVVGHPNILKRHIALPPKKEMGLKLSSGLRPQSSPLPAWTGPREFSNRVDDPNNDSTRWKFDIDSKGEFFAQAAKVVRNQFQPLELSKYSSTGQLLATKTSYTDKFSYDNAQRRPIGEHWLAVTEDSPTEETYQIYESSSGEYYGDGSNNGYKLLSEIYDTSLTPLRAAFDPLYPIFMSGIINPFLTTVKSGKKGIVLSSTTYDYQKVTLSEISHQPWDEMDEMNQLTFLAPKELPYTQMQSSFDVASDGSIYSAIFTPYDPYCGGLGCPVYAVLTKFMNGEIAWQDYWETADPETLMGVAANKNGASLLVNKGSITSGNADIESTIISFDSSGLPVSNVSVPLDQLRKDKLSYLPEDLRRYYLGYLKGIKTDDTGQLIAYGGNYIISGMPSSGLNQFYLYNDGKTSDPYNLDLSIPLSIGDLFFKGGYVYAHAPAVNNRNDTIIPLDTNLQTR